ncbi:hypothetical protein [Couchioplanes caeruleus]|uniref:Uncharacterized protein n=2 Tax=Couchioplanes caeruleus TaxID=56438 RepID=A0A1K0GC33_9ACTN|nr:hypothetical protein [Couchioplanes caeruleus]OJF09726.1 hypothetical protein BG844_36035 [Couchioplanes caeruleus subsp. caeruleus]ROP27397.1 hypothetical protein EDD30_0066 [Couchioplanes caeruleus]
MSRDSGSRTVTTRFVWLPHGSAAGWLLLHRTVTDHVAGDSTDEFWRSERISPGAVASGAFQDSAPEWHRIVTGEPVPFLLWPFFLAAVTDRELPAVREQIIRSPIRPLADISAEVAGTPGGPAVTAPRVVLAGDPFGPVPDDLDLGDGWDVAGLEREGRCEALLAAVQGRIRHAGIAGSPHGGAVWLNRFVARPEVAGRPGSVPPQSVPGSVPPQSAPGPVPPQSAPGPVPSQSDSPGSPGFSSAAPTPVQAVVSGPGQAGLDEVLTREPVRRAIADLLASPGDEAPRRAVVAELREHGWTLAAEPLRLGGDEPAPGFLGRLVLFCAEDGTAHHVVTTLTCAETLRRDDDLAATLTWHLCPLRAAPPGSDPAGDALHEALHNLPAEWDEAHAGTPGLAPPAWDEITTVTRDETVPGSRRPVEISHVELVDSNGRHSWRIDLSAPARPRTDADR